jgi:fermentation-respiration switch protein FrsA (DUF1100 family)
MGVATEGTLLTSEKLLQTIKERKGRIMSMYFMLVFLVIVLFACIVMFSICWYSSSRLLRRTSGSTSFNILVTAIDAQTITLQRTRQTARSGVFGIQGTQGQAIVGPLLSLDTKTVTRQLIESRGTLSPRTKVAWNTTVYAGELRDHLKLMISEVSIPSPLGEMPAWFVPGTLNTWAILVHGSTGTRQQGLRAFQTLANLGLPILDITYRNDEEAPSSPDGLSHLGDMDWEDLEAGVTYALAHGAQRLLLYGWSLGGTIVSVFLSRSSSASHVVAAILDSPILDWHATLDCLAKKNALPSFVARVTERIIAMRTGITFDTLNLLNQTQNHVPILLFHGENDTTAPTTISETFASASPMVRYHCIPEAEHTQCWNANPEKYETELRSFLREVLER